MRVLDDGTLYLEAGERFPYVCPVCNSYIPSGEATEVITCPKCQRTGTVAEFSQVLFFPRTEEVEVNSLVMSSGWKRCPICDVRTLRWRKWLQHIVVVHIHKRLFKRLPAPSLYPRQRKSLSEVRCPRCKKGNILEVPADWPPVTGLHCESCGLSWAQYL